MPYSSNQNQLGLLGPIALIPEEQFLTPSERSIRLWERLNLHLAQQAEEQFPEHYLRLRYEDLISKPEEVIQQLFDFLNIDKSADAYTHFVKKASQQDTVREIDIGEQNRLEALANKGLSYFGYLN